MQLLEPFAVLLAWLYVSACSNVALHSVTSHPFPLTTQERKLCNHSLSHGNVSASIWCHTVHFISKTLSMSRRCYTSMKFPRKRTKSPFPVGKAQEECQLTVLQKGRREPQDRWVCIWAAALTPAPLAEKLLLLAEMYLAVVASPETLGPGCQHQLCPQRLCHSFLVVFLIELWLWVKFLRSRM